MDPLTPADPADSADSADTRSQLSAGPADTRRHPPTPADPEDPAEQSAGNQREISGCQRNQQGQRVSAGRQRDPLTAVSGCQRGQRVVSGISGCPACPRGYPIPVPKLTRSGPSSNGKPGHNPSHCITTQIMHGFHAEPYSRVLHTGQGHSQSISHAPYYHSMVHYKRLVRKRNATQRIREQEGEPIHRLLR